MASVMRKQLQHFSLMLCNGSLSQKTAHAGSVSVAESLYKNKSSLEAIFRILDKDNSGQISLEEFQDACELIRTHLVEHGTIEQLLDMCKMMDINKDGLVDLNEFLETFRLCQMNIGRPSYDFRGDALIEAGQLAGKVVGETASGAGASDSKGNTLKKDESEEDYEDYDSTASRKGKTSKKPKGKVSIEGNGKTTDDDTDKKAKPMFI
jgi:EF-hand domain pair